MTSIKVAIGAVGMIVGSGATVTGFIAQTSISEATPVTFSLVTAGLGLTATLAWKVSRAWAQLEARLIKGEEKFATLERDIEFLKSKLK